MIQEGCLVCVLQAASKGSFRIIVELYEHAAVDAQGILASGSSFVPSELG